MATGWRGSLHNAGGLRIVALYDQSRAAAKVKDIFARKVLMDVKVYCARCRRMRVRTHRRARAHTHMCGSVVLAAVLVFAAVGLVGFGCGFDIESIALAPTLRCALLCAAPMVRTLEHRVPFCRRPLSRV